MRVIWKVSQVHIQYPKEIDSEGIEFDFRGRVAEAEEGRGSQQRQRKARGGHRGPQMTALSSNTESPCRVM